jgi:predicted dehydrogenase
MSRSNHTNRRSFLKQAAAAIAAPAFIRNLHAAAPSEVVRHASFGATGMANADLSAIANHPQVKIICAAEVDLSRVEGFKKRFPEARVYQDWREMLDKEHKNLDSVNVSTPDHMHAAMAMSSLQLGLNVYCQKPLTHDVYESRRLAEVAAEKKLVTQMGIQVHSSVQYRSAVELVQSGAIGKVKTVHSWSSKKWGDNSPRPEKEDTVPESLNWDLWLGVAANRPFIGDGYYHPGNWRKRLDFGTGTFGDMGCHIFDPVFKALELTAPLTARSTGPAPNAHNLATDAVVHFTFPQTKHTVGPTIPITWYDGDQRPSKEITDPILGDQPLPDQGSLFIGENGALLLPHVKMPILLPEEKFKDHPRPQLADVNHWNQFVEAVRGNGKTSAHFGYSGPLSESVLLGGVATHFRDKQLEWDAAGVRFRNCPEAEPIIRRTYRKGWEVTGLS